MEPLSKKTSRVLLPFQGLCLRQSGLTLRRDTRPANTTMKNSTVCEYNAPTLGGRAAAWELSGQCVVICLWGVGEVSLNTLWGWLGKALGAALITQVHKCLAVAQQSNTQRRFDMFVTKDSAATVLNKLLAKKAQYKWHCRLHVQPGMGTRAPITTERKSLTMGTKINGPLTMATWNINGLRAKRVELDVFLLKKQPAFIAIQETHRAEGSWRLTLPGYSVIERMANRAENAQGVLLAARTDLGLIEMEDASQYWVLGQSLGKQRVVVGSIYLPSQQRRVIKGELKAALQKILAKDANVRIVLMGDFNMNTEKVDRMFVRWGMPLQVLQTKGSGNTWHQANKTTTAIDHIVVSQSVKEMCSRASVDRSWDVSDHWPMLAKMNVATPNVLPVTVKETFNRSELKVKAVQFGFSTYWEPLRLMAEDSQVDANELPAAFEKASWAAAREVGATKEIKNGTKSIRFHSLQGCLQAIEERRLAYKKLRAAKGQAEEAQLRTEYTKAKSKAVQAVKEAKQWQWLQYVKKASQLAVDGRTKDLWVWIQRFTGRGKGPRTSAVQPVRQKGTDKLLTEPKDIGNEWAAHYAMLAADETGHSRNADHWSGIAKPASLSEMPMDETISMEEVLKVVKNMANGTAPGSDGIPLSFSRQRLSGIPRAIW